MNLYERGKTITLYATFLKKDGSVAVISETPKITISYYSGTSEVKIVDNKDMDNLYDSTYLYQYNIPSNALKIQYNVKYSALYDDSTTVIGSETYSVVENNSFGPNAGSIIQNGPSNIVDKKQIEFRERVMLELKKLNLDINDIKSTPQVINVDEILNNIKLFIDKLNNELSLQHTDIINKCIESINNFELSNSEVYSIINERLDNIKLLGSNILNLIEGVPNVINISMDNIDKSNLLNFNNINERILELNKDIKDQNMQVSKFSNDEIKKLDLVSKQFNDKISKLSSEVKNISSEIPLFVSKKIDDLDNKLNDNYANVITENNNVSNNMLVKIDETNNIISENSNNASKLLNSKIIEVKEIISNLNKDTKEDYDVKISELKEELNNLNTLIKKIDINNKNNILKVSEQLPKLSNKKDINYIEVEISDKIKELQANNTKKIKVLRDNLELLKNEIDNNKKDSNIRINAVKNLINMSIDDNDLNSQMAMLK